MTGPDNVPDALPALPGQPARRTKEIPATVNVAGLAEVASMLGDLARSRMMTELLNGRPLTARQLADYAGITPQTASGHISKLVSAGLIIQRVEGRRRLHRLAGREVVDLLDALNRVASRLRPPATGHHRHQLTSEMREARLCYDHLGGRVGSHLAAAVISPAGHGCHSVSASMAPRLSLWGVESQADDGFCRLCEDWTEKAPHLGGELGTAILNRSLELDWVRPRTESRALMITHAGRAGFHELFGIDMRC